MRSDTCPGERPVSQKPAPVTVVPGSRARAKVAPAGKGGERPRGDACHRPESRDREPGQHRPRACPRHRHRDGDPKPQGAAEAPAPAPGQGTRPGRALPWARGHRGGRTHIPKNIPGHFLRRGRGRKGLSSNLETRRSGLHRALLFLLLLGERGHGPLHPRGACHGLGAPRTPSLPRGTAGHPAPFPGPRRPWASRAFPGALRAFPGVLHIFSRGTPPPFPARSSPGHPHLSPGPPGTPRPFPGHPAFPPGPGVSAPPCPAHSTPARGTPGQRAPGPAAEGGRRGVPAAARSAEPRMGRCGARGRGTHGGTRAERSNIRWGRPRGDAGSHLRNSCRQVSQKRWPQVETRTGSRMGFPQSGHSTRRRGRSSSL